MNGLFEAITKLFGHIAFWVTVAPWEQAIRVRMGKNVTLLPPGIHVRLPVLDVAHKQTVRRRNVMISTQTLSTSDGSTVVIAASLGYAIGDIEALYKSLHDAEETLRQIASTTLASRVMQRSRADLSPDLLGATVTADLATAFTAFGIVGVEVRVTDFAFIRAIRLIQDARWGNSDGLKMEATP